jgi:hypothetical protein
MRNGNGDLNDAQWERLEPRLVKKKRWGPKSRVNMRGVVSSAHGMSVVHVAQGIFELGKSIGILATLEPQRHVGKDQHGFTRSREDKSREGGNAHRRDRQPVGKDDAKRWARGYANVM